MTRDESMPPKRLKSYEVWKSGGPPQVTKLPPVLFSYVITNCIAWNKFFLFYSPWLFFGPHVMYILPLTILLASHISARLGSFELAGYYEIAYIFTVTRLQTGSPKMNGWNSTLRFCTMYICVLF